VTQQRELDLVLYGATGFVGKLTAEYLAGAAPDDARIALAGRSLDKLRAVRTGLGERAAEWSLIVADAGDQPALDAMARRATVVVTTVGPYARYGLPLVQACANAGTHYADLTGEPLFIRDCIDRYHSIAAGTGAKIVNSCGFDSVPSDLNAYLLHRRVLVDDAGELAETTLVASMKGGLSGGTIDSGRAQMEAIAKDPSLGRVVTDPYALSPDRSREPDLGKQSDFALHRAKVIDSSLSGWVSTFIMASHNTKVVRRSNGLLGWAYGKNFRYREVMSTGTSIAAPLVAAGVAGSLAAMNTLGPKMSRGRPEADRPRCTQTRYRSRRRCPQQRPLHDEDVRPHHLRREVSRYLRRAGRSRLSGNRGAARGERVGARVRHRPALRARRRPYPGHGGGRGAR